MPRTKFGLMYTHLEEIVGPVEVAQKAEAWGFDSFWAPDFALEPNLEPLTVLSAVAQATESIQLGTAVLVLPYKHPLALAKTAATVDILSNGRLILGMGIGGRSWEFEAMGVDMRHRGRVSDERLQVLKRLFTEDEVTHQGAFHQFENVTLLPRPIQQPHPPLWMGPVYRDGGFAEGALRRTARFCDGFFPTIVPPHGYREAQQLLRRYLEEYGRDPDALEWALFMWICIDDSMEEAWEVMRQESTRRAGTDEAQLGFANAVGTAADCIETIEEYLALGVTHIVLDVGVSPDRMLDQYQQIAETVVPHFAG